MALYQKTKLLLNSRPNLFLILLIIIVTLVYAKHFDNSLHFDDFHTVQDNPAIQDLRNIPSFFIDAGTFSVLPSNQSYRPVTTMTLAIDYWLGGASSNFWYHFSTFAWYLLQIVLMFVLFKRLITWSFESSQSNAIAFYMTAFYALHPFSAETVNYVIQRADLFSTLAVIAALLTWIQAPHLRRWGVYLLPIVVGALAKPPAIMFAPILMVYVLFFEENGSLFFWKKSELKKAWAAAIRCLPALIACLALYVLQDKLTAETFTPGGHSLWQYVITQPYVTFRYFKSILLPLDLTADTDQETFTSLLNPNAILGLVFIFATICATFWLSKNQRTRVISFGICWALIALIPTAVIPLAEVMNDHRVFFPLVGITLSLVSGVLIIAEYAFNKKIITLRIKKTLIFIGFLALGAYAVGTYQRNEVWHSEETLWLDVTQKSPKNGRGLMNYGLTQMAQAKYERALDYFERAQKLTPNYSTLEVNLGIVKNALNRKLEAEKHFLRAIYLRPRDSSPYHFYGRWLFTENRKTEAQVQLKKALETNIHSFKSRVLLMQVYLELEQKKELESLISETLKLLPNNKDALAFKKLLDSAKHAPVDNLSSAGQFLNLSLRAYQEKRYEDCIKMANKALEIDPNSAYAYNNISIANAMLKRWDLAISAAHKALELKPDFDLAKNNLAYALKQKSK